MYNFFSNKRENSLEELDKSSQELAKETNNRMQVYLKAYEIAYNKKPPLSGIPKDALRDDRFLRGLDQVRKKEEEPTGPNSDNFNDKAFNYQTLKNKK